MCFCIVFQLIAVTIVSYLTKLEEKYSVSVVGNIPTGYVVVQVSDNIGYLKSQTHQIVYTISGSNDWLRFCQGATDRQCLLRSPVAVA